MKLEDSLNGGYAGLYGEVVTEDCYRLRTLNFKPDVIFDIGANVGVFARHARSLFPDARIVSVEPDPKNCSVYLEHFPEGNTALLKLALGKGKIYHGLTARNGSGETYLSAGLGYPEVLMRSHVRQNPKDMEVSDVGCRTLQQIVIPETRDGQSSLLKIDCEGAENIIWGDKLAMHCLQRADYICMEIHFYALTGGEMPAVTKAISDAIEELKETHYVEFEGVHLWARKREKSLQVEDSEE